MADTASGLESLATGPTSAAAPKAGLAPATAHAGAALPRPLTEVGPKGLQVALLAALLPAAPTTRSPALPPLVRALTTTIGRVTETDERPIVVRSGLAPRRQT